MNIFLLSALVAGAYIVGALVGAFLNNNQAAKLLELLLPALAALIASYVGADRAFALEREREMREERRSELAAGNMANFVLSWYLNWLHVLRRDFIDPFREHPARELVMPPVTMSNMDTKLDFHSLSFLLAGDDPNLLGALAVAQDAFFAAMAAAKERSIIHIHEIQPRIEQAGIDAFDAETIQVVYRALGPRWTATIRDGTNSTIQSVDNALREITETSDRLHAELRKRFPSETVIQVGLPQPA